MVETNQEVCEYKSIVEVMVVVEELTLIILRRIDVINVWSKNAIEDMWRLILHVVASMSNRNIFPMNGPT